MPVLDLYVAFLSWFQSSPKPIDYDAGLNESFELDRVGANDIKIVSLDLTARLIPTESSRSSAQGSPSR
jgi:hypothetical protein